MSDDATVRDDIPVEANKRLDEAEDMVPSPEQPLEGGHMTNSSSESEAERVELEEPTKVFHPPRTPEGFEFVQNKRTKALHLVDGKHPSGACCKGF